MRSASRKRATEGLGSAWLGLPGNRQGESLSCRAATLTELKSEKSHGLAPCSSPASPDVIGWTSILYRDFEPRPTREDLPAACRPAVFRDFQIENQGFQLAIKSILVNPKLLRRARSVGSDIEFEFRFRFGFWSNHQITKTKSADQKPLEFRFDLNHSAQRKIAFSVLHHRLLPDLAFGATFEQRSPLT